MNRSGSVPQSRPQSQKALELELLWERRPCRGPEQKLNESIRTCKENSLETSELQAEVIEAPLVLTVLFKRPQQEAVLPEEPDTSSSLGWKLFRMDTSHAHTLTDRNRKFKLQTSQLSVN